MSALRRLAVVLGVAAVIAVSAGCNGNPFYDYSNPNGNPHQSCGGRYGYCFPGA